MTWRRSKPTGRITVFGRGSVCINSGGEKIFPEEVEAVIKAHPDVVDAVVVGVPDDRWGQRVAAVVETRDGREITLAAIDAHCRTKIAGYKVPRQLRVVEEIVRHPSGKPDYRWASTVARAAAAPAGASRIRRRWSDPECSSTTHLKSSVSRRSSAPTSPAS